ncbi:MAG: hypothetical protein Q8S21_04115 [Candidatus Paracaedibacteraceae bacterium]|nr:hypothetical protein [Candidatus Paracaedibacteraceae bacterium]
MRNNNFMLKYMFWYFFLITSACSSCCFKNLKEIAILDFSPEMEVHGSLMTYFKSHETGKDIFKYSGSAILYNSEIAITAAHLLFIRGDNEQDKSHCNKYSSYASKVIFRTYSGAEYLCAHLEIVYTRDRIEGSNPFLSSIFTNFLPIKMNAFFILIAQKPF